MPRAQWPVDCAVIGGALLAAGEHGGVVRDQFVACGGPGAAQHGAAGGGAEAGAHRRVQQVLDGVAERGVVADEVARAAGQDQVARAAGVRRDDGQPGGERFLDGLAERLRGPVWTKTSSEA